MTITLHMGQILNTFKELNRDIPVEIRKVMNWQCALVAQRVIRDIAANPAMSLSAQRKAQEQLISADVGRLFDLSKLEGGIHQWALPDGDTLLKMPSGAKIFVDSEHFNVSKVKVFNLHSQNRDSAGRIPKGISQSVVRGGRTYSMKYWSKDPADVLDLIKFKQAHIGRTKASFLKALDFFSSRSGGMAAWVAPSWVTRNKGWGNMYGVASETFDATAMTGVWTLGSNVPWIARRDAQSRVDFAMRLRQIDFDSGRVFKKLIGMIESKSAA